MQYVEIFIMQPSPETVACREKQKQKQCIGLVWKGYDCPTTRFLQNSARMKSPTTSGDLLTQTKRLETADLQNSSVGVTVARCIGGL
jgi:hypothetical protein